MRRFLEKTYLKNKWVYLNGLFIFLLFLIVRLWHIPQLFFFGIDEEYQSLLGWSIVKNFHVIWIGTSMADTGFYLGPGFVYVHAFLLLLSYGDPVILGYAGAFIGIVTTIVLFFTAKNLFSTKIGYIASILYGFSTFMNFADRRFWNPTLIPLVSILIVYALIKSQKNERWLIALAFLVASTLHIHASLFVYFFIVPIILLIILKRRKKYPSLQTSILSAITFIGVSAPLIVFDFVHNFDNLKTPIRLLSLIGSNPLDQPWYYPVQLFFHTLMQSFYYFTPTETISLFIPILLFIFWFFWKHKKDHHYTLLFIIFVLYSVFFILYPGKVHAYYLLGLIPLFFTVSSVALSKLPNKILSILLAIYIGVNIFTFTISTRSMYGTQSKKLLIEKLMSKIGNTSFYLATPDPYRMFGGWRYLFQVYGKKPVQSDADQMFGWIYPDEIDKTTKSKYTIFITTEKKEDSPYTFEIYELPYYGYIIKQ